MSAPTVAAPALPWWRRPWPGLAGLMALAVAVWWRVPRAGHVTYDTPWLVIDNPILGTGSVSALPALLDLDRGTRLVLGAEFLPVRDLTVLLDFALFGRSWTLHHASTLAWYLLACGCLFFVLRALLGPGLKAWFAAALYTIHPTHVESVAWLASRKDAVSLAIFWGAVLLYMHRARFRASWLLLPLMMALAHWAKNTAIVLPALLVLVSLLHERADPRQPRWWLSWVPLGLVAAGTMGLSLYTGGLVGMYTEARADHWWQILGIEAEVFVRYFGMLLWPDDLAVLYSEPGVRPPSDPGLWWRLGLALAPLGIALVCIRRRPLVSLGIAWFYGALLPVSQIVPIQNLQADRYLLIPSAGAALALMAALPDKVPASWRSLGLALGGLALLALGARTLDQTQRWHSDVDLWQQAHERSPAPVKASTRYAAALRLDGQPAAAAQALGEALQDHPEHPELLQAQGTLALAQGDLPAAQAAFEAALAANPKLRKARQNLAQMLRTEGDLPNALEQAQALSTHHPLYAPSWALLGSVLLDLERAAEAQAAFERGLALNPMHADLLYNLGAALYLQGDRVGAAEQWEAVLVVAPGHGQATAGLAHLKGG